MTPRSTTRTSRSSALATWCTGRSSAPALTELPAWVPRALGRHRRARSARRLGSRPELVRHRVAAVLRGLAVRHQQLGDRAADLAVAGGRPVAGPRPGGPLAAGRGHVQRDRPEHRRGRRRRRRGCRAARSSPASTLVPVDAATGTPVAGAQPVQIAQRAVPAERRGEPDDRVPRRLLLPVRVLGLLLPQRRERLPDGRRPLDEPDRPVRRRRRRPAARRQGRHRGPARLQRVRRRRRR